MLLRTCPQRKRDVSKSGITTMSGSLVAGSRAGSSSTTLLATLVSLDSIYLHA